MLIPNERENQDLAAIPGMLASLVESPDGFAGEWEEWTKTVGLEAMYESKKMIYGLRTGIWKEWGFTTYQTIGLSLGGKFEDGSRLQLDYAYYLPYQRNDPLQHTPKFTLSYVRGV